MTGAAAAQERPPASKASKKKAARKRRPAHAKKSATWSTEEVATAVLAKMKAPYNPRKISPKMLARLRKSIRTDGFLQNIVCNRRTKHVVGGHQRIVAAQAYVDGDGAKHEAIERLPVYWIDVDEKTEKRVNLTLNSVAGEFIPDQLGAVLRDLDSAARKLTGFEPAELERLMKGAGAARTPASGEQPTLNRSVQAVLTLPTELAGKPAFTAALDKFCGEHGVAYRLRRGS